MNLTDQTQIHHLIDQITKKKSRTTIILITIWLVNRVIQSTIKRKENKFLIDIKILNRTLKLQSSQNNFMKEQIKTINPEEELGTKGAEVPNERIIKYVQEENEYEVFNQT